MLAKNIAIEDHKKTEIDDIDFLINKGAQAIILIDRMFGELREEPTSTIDLTEFIETIEQQITELKKLTSHLDSPKLSINELETPAENTPRRKIRDIIFSIFQSSSEAIGRNTAEATKEDIVARLGRLNEKGLLPSYSAKQHSTPENYVSTIVIPKLDPDMKKYAFHMDVYCRPLLKFYSTIKVMRARSQTGVNKFISTHRKR